MRITSGRHVAKNPDALAWWDSLYPEDAQTVIEWVRNNMPPPEWRAAGWTSVDWAYTEMPFAPDRRTP